MDLSASSLSELEMQTSNIGVIKSTVGGVGHNVALAATRAGSKAALYSLVAEDL